MDWDRRLPRDCAEGVGETALPEHRWIDPPRERPQLIDRPGRFLADRFELSPQIRIPSGLLCEPNLELDPREPLLRAIVEVSLEPAAPKVTCLNDPCACIGELTKRLLPSRTQLGVLEREQQHQTRRLQKRWLARRWPTGWRTWRNWRC